MRKSWKWGAVRRSERRKMGQDRDGSRQAMKIRKKKGGGGRKEERVTYEGERKAGESERSFKKCELACASRLRCPASRSRFSDASRFLSFRVLSTPSSASALIPTRGELKIGLDLLVSRGIYTGCSDVFGS